MFDTIVVISVICLMLFLLVKGYLRPGLILFCAVVVLLTARIITPEEALAGFSNRGVITVALLFLVSEGVRQSGSLQPLMRHIFPKHNPTYRRGYCAIVPVVSLISAFMNNTPIVVIFIPQIKMWCRQTGLSLKKFLIPLSYAAILGGMCTLIGTSTNLVVHGLMLDMGMSGFSLFELGKVGVIIAAIGTLYIILFGERLLPTETSSSTTTKRNIVEVVLASRFPGIRCTIDEFDFHKHYGAHIVSIRRDGEPIDDFSSYTFRENDTLTLSASHNFIESWGSSRIFLITTNGTDHTTLVPRWKSLISLLLLLIMIIGAALSSLPFAANRAMPDMFLWAAIVVVIMAMCNTFPAKRYTKFISWDILITIASALAISRAMINSGVADIVAQTLIAISHTASPHLLLAAIYITTNIITELITNNAAAAFAFPIAISVAEQLSVNPLPFCVAITIAASASFCTPIGYQTNTIVQGLAGYRFSDFVRIGLPLSALTFIISMIFIPLFWHF